MGAAVQGLGSFFQSPSSALGDKGTRAPAVASAPAVTPAPQITDKAAQDASTTAAINQAQYGPQNTILTGGRGVTGATVQKAGLTTGTANPYPTLFAKYLGG